jgi:L-ascorbate metabolism protein UlaG (beta-lactamase superfamily)
MSESLSRGEFIQIGAAGAATGSSTETVAQAPRRNAALKVRWYGGGVVELASPDDKTIVLVDAWVWNNNGFKLFPDIPKPAELASATAFGDYMKNRAPNTVIVALTHDHGDHIGDYFEVLDALMKAGIDVKTVGQSDLMRAALPPKFKAANLDPAALVLNSGAGMNFGGLATYKDVRMRLVPAMHSTLAGYPAAGFIIDIAGVRVYASGDTDLFGGMEELGTRYRPDLAFLSAGNGPYTMGPGDAAMVCKLMGLRHAIPVHYAHNPQVLGPTTGETFRAAVARVSPSTKVTVLRPGEPTRLSVAVSGVASA